MKDPMRPPAKRTRNEITKAATRLATLRHQRRKLIKRLEEIDQEIRDAKRILSAIIEDAVPEIAPVRDDAAADMVVDHLRTRYDSAQQRADADRESQL